MGSGIIVKPGSAGSFIFDENRLAPSATRGNAPRHVAPTEGNMRILRIHEVVERTTYSAMHLSRLEKAGKFPKRIQVGANRVGWLESEVDDFIKEKAENHRGPLPAPKIKAG